jgi:predicted  nucleic acid-binding Zn-ribbon protein
VQKTTYALIELQEVDNRLDELMEERGDLPLIVEDLKTKLDEKKISLEEMDNALKETKVHVKNIEVSIEESKDKLKKYEDQLYQVKTNKEYDAMTIETETVKEQLAQYEKDLVADMEKIEKLSAELTTLEDEIGKLEGEFEENTIELESKMRATAEEENMLVQERKIILEGFSKQIVSTYEKVRKARDGMGVADIKNGVCGGCFSYIPPQKVVEIKKMKKIYTCEFCGRILVYNEPENA